MPSPSALKVIIVAENASTTFGGESILPWHYFRLLHRRGVDVRLVTHERTRVELEALLPEARDRMHFVPDLAIQRAINGLPRVLSTDVAENTLGLAIHFFTCAMQRRLVRELVSRYGAHVIHEPTPVSPKQPSFMYDLGAPVVIGPMNGGMDYPEAFRGERGLSERLVFGVGRRVAQHVNRLIPGKRKAAVLLVANERTRRALPRYATSNVRELVENGVDLALFAPRRAPRATDGHRVRFLFMGRLVEIKCVDLLLEAFARCPASYELTLLGDGHLRASLEQKAAALALSGRVTFAGQVDQKRCSEVLGESDALVLPSLRECGGAVVLEAMAMGVPVIASDWGGPRDYLDADTGILVPVGDRACFIDNLHRALLRMGSSPELRARLGAAGRARVEREFDWERKIDRMLEIYADAAHLPRPARSAEEPEARRTGLGA